MKGLKIKNSIIFCSVSFNINNTFCDTNSGICGIWSGNTKPNEEGGDYNWFISRILTSNNFYVRDSEEKLIKTENGRTVLEESLLKNFNEGNQTAKEGVLIELKYQGKFNYCFNEQGLNGLNVGENDKNQFKDFKNSKNLRQFHVKVVEGKLQVINESSFIPGPQKENSFDPLNNKNKSSIQGQVKDKKKSYESKNKLKDSNNKEHHDLDSLFDDKNYNKNTGLEDEKFENELGDVNDLSDMSDNKGKYPENMQSDINTGSKGKEQFGFGSKYNKEFKPENCQNGIPFNDYAGTTNKGKSKKGAGYNDAYNRYYDMFSSNKAKYGTENDSNKKAKEESGTKKGSNKKI